MTSEESFANRLLTTSASRSFALCILALVSCGVGCASSGTLQPHQAFRQATTPYQGYYQGQQSGYAAAGGYNSGSVGDFAGYGGYNNSLPGYGQPNPATGEYGAYGNQFANPSAGQSPIQGGYGQYAPNAGYNFQPSYSTGFTSGSC